MKQLEFDFSGQTVLVTGASRGIGCQIALDFERLGAELIRTDTNSVDFSDSGSTQEFLESLKGKRIDILVNNAAWNRNNLINEASVGDFDKVIAVDLKAPWLLARTVGPEMKARGYGRIVNIASILSRISIAGRSAYSSAKSGLEGMTRALALDLAPEVLVNAVSPGFVDTEMTRRTQTPEKIEEIRRRIPLTRLASPVDVSSVVLFLASRNNTYILGQNIFVDGGYTIT